MGSDFRAKQRKAQDILSPNCRRKKTELTIKYKKKKKKDIAMTDCLVIPYPA